VFFSMAIRAYKLQIAQSIVLPIPIFVMNF
jgi:hypothetical protein